MHMKEMRAWAFCSKVTIARTQPFMEISIDGWKTPLFFFPATQRRYSLLHWMKKREFKNKRRSITATAHSCMNDCNCNFCVNDHKMQCNVMQWRYNQYQEDPCDCYIECNVRFTRTSIAFALILEIKICFPNKLMSCLLFIWQRRYMSTIWERKEELKTKRD